MSLSIQKYPIVYLKQVFDIYLLKKSSMNFNTFPDILLSFNFNNKPSCQTLSKAFDMSRKTLLNSQPSSNDL